MKKGLSGVVVSVLLVLLSLAAVTIIWSFLSNNLQTSGEQIENAYPEVRMDIDNLNLVIDPIIGSVKIPVRRNAGVGQVAGFNILVYDSFGNQYIKRVNQTINELESKVVSFFYSGLVDVKKIEVVPIFVNTKGKNVIGSSLTSASTQSIPLSNPDKKPLLSSSLVGYWPLDEDSNGITKDKLNSTHLPTLGLTIVDGKRGKAIKLRVDAPTGCESGNSGASNTSVSGYAPIANLPQREYSLSWWNKDIMSGSTRVNLKDNFGVAGCGNCGRWFTFNYIWTRRSESPWDSAADITFTVPAYNQWHHYMYVFNRTALKEALYIDGVLVPGSDKSLPSGNYGLITSVDLGVYDFGCSDAHAGGTIDDVMLFNKTLNAQEVLELYQSY